MGPAVLVIVIFNIVICFLFFLGSQAKVLSKKQYACQLQKGTLESVYISVSDGLYLHCVPFTKINQQVNSAVNKPFDYITNFLSGQG